MHTMGSVERTLVYTMQYVLAYGRSMNRERNELVKHKSVKCQDFSLQYNLFTMCAYQSILSFYWNNYSFYLILVPIKKSVD